MKTIKISNFSIYSNGVYTPDNEVFTKLYKGVRVNVDNGSDGKYMHFSIRTKKTRTCIWKRGCERMDNLIFDDVNHSITCVFENEPKNKCPHTLVFESEIYDDLKTNIPMFMKECGCDFDVLETYGQMILEF